MSDSFYSWGTLTITSQCSTTLDDICDRYHHSTVPEIQSSKEAVSCVIGQMSLCLCLCLLAPNGRHLALLQVRVDNEAKCSEILFLPPTHTTTDGQTTVEAMQKKDRSQNWSSTTALVLVKKDGSVHPIQVAPEEKDLSTQQSE